MIKPYYKNNSSKPLQDALKDALKNALKNALKENHNQRALEGDYNSNIIIVDVPQLQHGRGRPKGSRNY